MQKLSQIRPKLYWLIAFQFVIFFQALISDFIFNQIHTMLLINLIVYPVFITLCLLASKHPKAMYSAAPVIGILKYTEIIIQLYWGNIDEKQ